MSEPDVGVCEASVFRVTFSDGSERRLWKACRQPYEDSEISAGFVLDDEVDTRFLRFEREDADATTILLRPDELAAILYVVAGAEWTARMYELAGTTPQEALGSEDDISAQQSRVGQKDILAGAVADIVAEDESIQLGESVYSEGGDVDEN